MEKYSLGSTGWVLALALTLSIMIPVYCLAVDPSPSCRSIAAGLACETIKSDEKRSTCQQSSNHPQIKSERSTAEIKARTEPLSDTLQGASVGTGWPTVSGYVVTSNHVVEGSNDVVVISRLGEELPAQLVLGDQVKDIAI